MNFNKHLKFEGKHAFLSASKYHWLKYDDDKLAESYFRSMAAQKGTELHEFAATCIKLGQKLPRSKKTLNSYVNDAIGFKMEPEVMLFYSENCFGTADAISFRNNILRIHDLKTGISPSNMTQLEIYAAMFCLEYRIKPKDIEIHLSIYQNDMVLEHCPEVVDILYIMDRIKSADKIISSIASEEV